MRDLQNESEGFVPRPIQSVGVSGIKGIISLSGKASAKSDAKHLAGNGQSARYSNYRSFISYPLHLMAQFSAICPLPATQRGLNMSRTGRAIYDFLKNTENTGIDTLEPLAKTLMQVHGTVGASVRASFDYPIEIKAPVTGIMGIKCVHAAIKSEIAERKCRNCITVSTSEMSLCPCSKIMSMAGNGLGRGAHNQIADISATVELKPTDEAIPAGKPLQTAQGGLACVICDIYDILSSCASSVTYPVLKRDDEKFVTEQAWDNPRFVEDIVRLAAARLDGFAPILHYSVTAKSHESIHSDGIEAVATIGEIPRFEYVS